jgi:HEPN domain-containing protein
MSDRTKQAVALYRRALEDLILLRKVLDDREVSDNIWGFHAQQAVEKCLKALLATQDVDFPFSHRLYELADLLAERRRPLPAEFAILLDLTPFAVEMRYALDASTGRLPTTRQSLLRLIDGLVQLVQRAVE